MSFGGSIKLTGETEYKKALKQISQNLKEVSSEIKLVSTEYDKNDKSEKALTAQSEVLNKQLQEQQKKVDLLNAEYEEMAKTQDEDSVSMSKLRTEINKAQTDVNNTAKAIDNLGKETEESGKQAEKSGDGYTVLKNVLSNLASQAIHNVLNGLKSLGVAFVNLGKQALNSYAEFEQLEGGVKKLFGDDVAETVIANANKAFRTAGLSANEYMNTVTSFSAALISGLAGDTEKSAEIADIAIRDMADNANTFGTDIQSIQNAYQGFAKQNYTMLDNLKLGYGGTASEMARLVNESGVLGDSMEVTAQTVKEIPFADIILAINKTQERMGVLGTTAKEASGTIEGSFNSTSSAWKNMIANLANDEADFESLIKDFVGSFTSSMQNTIPRIQNIIQGAGDLFGQLIKEIVPQIIEMIPPLLEQMIPVLMDAIRNLLDSLLSVLPSVIPVVAQLLVDCVGTIMDYLPEILRAGIQMIKTLASGIKDAIPDLIAMLPDLIVEIVDVLAEGSPELIESGLQIIGAVIQGIIRAVPKLLSKIGEIGKNLVVGLWEGIKSMANWIWDKITGFFGGIIDGVKNFLGIHSPSTVFRDTIGKNLAKGIGVGFEDEMKAVSADMQDAIPMFDAPATTTTRRTDAFGDMVAAFKDALYEVKIELDDEVAGRFVENTVARSIYA